MNSEQEAQLDDGTETDGIETVGIDADGSDSDEDLDEAAQGESGTSDVTSDGTGEIDALGKAAGLSTRDDRPFRGIEEVDRRDDSRWELDPASAEDAAER